MAAPSSFSPKTYEVGDPRPKTHLTESWFPSYLVCMKATIEFDDELYRQLKATAALRGSKIKELVAEGVRMVLRHADAPRQFRRVKLPMVKSRKPGTLKLTGRMIAEHEARIDAGNEA
jgi:hypothetical protein